MYVCLFYSTYDLLLLISVDTVLLRLLLFFTWSLFFQCFFVRPITRLPSSLWSLDIFTILSFPMLATRLFHSVPYIHKHSPTLQVCLILIPLSVTSSFLEYPSKYSLSLYMLQFIWCFNCFTSCLCEYVNSLIGSQVSCCSLIPTLLRHDTPIGL